MNIIGINAAYHESSASLVVGGRVVAAAEEERFNRIKHAKPARVDNAHHLPIAAIFSCLSQAGITVSEVDAFCFSFDPSLRRSRFILDQFCQPGDWGHSDGETTFLASLAQVPEALSYALDQDVSQRFHWVPHHLSHAASAYYPSGFDHAAVLVVDGIAESASSLMAIGDGPKLTPLHEVDYPNSLGFMWEKFSEYLGFSEYDACKVMGLAAYGEADAMKPALAKVATVHDGGFQINPEVIRFRAPNHDGLSSVFGPARAFDAPIEPHHMHLAAALQDFTNRALLSLVQDLHQRAPTDNLCLAGGVALNCVTNYLVKEKGPFSNVYIPPAPHDAGTAVGAALAYWSASTGQPVAAEQATPYCGQEYDDDTLVAALESAGLKFMRCADPAEEAAALLAENNIVAWFQGRMELGPRALGNRSLLANPCSSETRDLLNRKVKHREDFRPFGPSVLAERAAEWFDIGRPSRSLGYMLFACPVHPGRRSSIPAVVHIDGSARVQVVEQSENPIYHRLISAFERLTGIPIVLNTSFNDSEPIVCSPQDAINTFKSTNIDALIMGPWLVFRPEPVI